MGFSFRTWGSILIGGFILGLAVFTGCTRPLSVSPLPGMAFTPTSTSTSTSAVPPTATLTPITMGLTDGPATPGASTQLPGTTGVPVLQVAVSNPSNGPATLSGLTVTAGGTGNDATGITAVKVYLDANGNGIVDGGDTLLATSTFSGDNGTANLSFSVLFNPSSTADLLVVYDLSGSASGTFQPSLATNGGLNGTDGSGQPLLFSGAPIVGATIMAASATFTPTRTNTGVNTATSTSTGTNTPTLVPTNTFTSTLTPTSTITATATNTGANTATSTNTLTSTPTATATDTAAANTATSTATDTVAADTATSTTTATATDTVAGNTATPTPTSTNTTCVPSLQTTYTFDSSTECWTAWSGGSPTLPAMTTYVDSVGTHSGAGALAVVIPYSSTEQAMIGLDFASPVTIPAGSILTFWYKSSVAGGSGQAFDQSNGYQWNGGAWQGSLSTSWTQVSFSMNPVNPNQVEQIGFQVPGNAGDFTSPVTIWIDDVTISPPPTPTPTVAANCSPLFNGAESMVDNGAWSGTNSSFSLSATGATQGSTSLDVNVTTGNGWNDQFLKLTGFAPKIWAPYSQLSMDVNVDANIISTQGGWGQFLLFADTNDDGGHYYIQISSTTAALAAGQQTLTFNLDFPNAITSGMALNDFFIIYQSGSGGTGHIYIDNMKLTYATCPPAPDYAWYFESGAEGWTSGAWLNGGAGETVGQVSPGYAGSLGALNGYIPFATTGDQEALVFTFPSDVDLTGKTIEADIWIDAAINPSGYPSGFILVQSGAWVSETGPGGWNNLTLDGWTHLSFTPTWTGGDSTQVKQVGILINVGTGVPSISPGNIKVDNVIIH